MQDENITDPDTVARYIHSVRDLYGSDSAMEVAEPPIVVKTSGRYATSAGDRVMVWLFVAEEDLTA